MDRFPRALTRPFLALAALCAAGIVQWAISSMLEETRALYGWKWADVGAAAVNAMAPIVHFLIAAGAALVVIWIIRTLLEQPSSIGEVVSSPAPTAAPSEAFVPSNQPPERIFLGPEVTPESLLEPFRQNTALQASRIIEPYIGKWMAFQGSIADLRPGLVDEKRTHMYLNGLGGVMLMFDAEWRDRIHTLQIGHNVKVIGRVDYIIPTHISLTSCELI